jgi:[methyl-Co(III) methanol-specific corrinoid protein]:coenzyme M methyltransferase
MITPKQIFMRALNRKSVQRPATGSATSVITIDLMEKTGVFFPDAHLNAEKMALLAAAGYTEIGFDNIMSFFSVWHESAAMGCQVDWGKPDRMPDCKDSLYRIDDHIRIPKDLLKRPGCRVPLEALKILKKKFDNEVAVLGKIFGPWTLGYHLFGVEEFLLNTILNPDKIKKIIDILKEVAVIFGNAQIDAGADALCFADHATRDLCSPDAYCNFLKEVHQEINERLNCPLILHICGDTSDRIPYIRDTGITCFHFDSKVPVKIARQLAGDKLSLMGGTSNIEIIRNGSTDAVRQDVKEKIRLNIDIIGPECAVPLDASYKNMKVLTEEVKKS